MKHCRATRDNIHLLDPSGPPAASPSPCSSTSTLTPVPDSPLTPAPPSPEPEQAWEEAPSQGPSKHCNSVPHQDKSRTANKRSAPIGKVGVRERGLGTASRSKRVQNRAASHGETGHRGVQATRSQKRAPPHSGAGVMRDVPPTKRARKLERTESESTAGTIQVADIGALTETNELTGINPARPQSQVTQVSRPRTCSRTIPIPKSLLAGLHTAGGPAPVPVITQVPQIPPPRPALPGPDGPTDRLNCESPKTCPNRVLYQTKDHRTTGGISSRTFARVLRLVANLPPSTGILRSGEKYSGPLPMPPVWAESRQELCEALPYYRAFQSGLYMNSRIAYGYLLEAFGAPRDIWAHGGRVVISHGGGQCIRTSDHFGAKGNPVLCADQTASDSRVDTLLNAYHHRTPLILLAGEGYDTLPFALNRAYVVLGWYWISAVWVEAEPAGLSVQSHPSRDYFHRYKVRFDWIESQGLPWWDSYSVVEPSDPTASSSQARADVRIVQAQVAYAHGLMTPPVAEPRPGGMSLPKASWRQSTPPATPASPTPRPSPVLSPILRPSRACNELQEQTGVLRLDGTLPTTRGLSADERAEDSLEHSRDACPWRLSSFANDQLGPLGIALSAAPSSRLLPGNDALSAQVAGVTYGPEYRAAQPREMCPACGKHSDSVYEEGWICTNPDCARFWLLETRIGLFPIPPGFSLQYDTKWLRPARTPGDIGIPYDIRPSPPAVDAIEVERYAGDRTLWKGWVCRHCGRANCRYRWEVWHCKSCDRLFAPLSSETLAPNPQSACSPVPLLGDANIAGDSGVRTSMRRIYHPSGTLVIHDLPANGCSILHFVMDDKGTADHLWRAYQNEAACSPVPLFQRRAMAAHTSKGQLLSQQFAVNSGVQYKYIVDTLSSSFEDSPAITNAVEAALGERVAFNEVLSVIYREGQKMSWHDDGEQGLGPVVASLSLGSSATMSWRAKGKRNVPNTGYFHGRQSLKPRTNPSTVLSITLQHGDIMIMSGANLQTMYNHRVVPHGYRVAATARVISLTLPEAV